MTRCYFCDEVTYTFNRIRIHNPGPRERICDACLDRRAVGTVPYGKTVPRSVTEDVRRIGGYGCLVYVGDDLEEVDSLKTAVAMTMHDREGPRSP